jgi:hypothetical protein
MPYTQVINILIIICTEYNSVTFSFVWILLSIHDLYTCEMDKKGRRGRECKYTFLISAYLHVLLVWFTSNSYPFYDKVCQWHVKVIGFLKVRRVSPPIKLHDCHDRDVVWNMALNTNYFSAVSKLTHYMS